MRVAIVEDENIAAQRLSNLIRKYDPEIIIETILDSVEDAIIWLKNNKTPDLLFLDIELSDGLSFEIFNHISIHVPVIFTTAYNEYTLRAFDLHCIDYLIKPISSEKFNSALHKLQKYSSHFSSSINESQISGLITSIVKKEDIYRNRFLITKTDGFIPIFIDDIAYFISENEKVFLFTESGEKHPIDYTIENLINDLDPKRFWRANRSAIVSAKAIVKAHNYFNYKIKLQLKPPLEKDVIISRAKVKAFKQWFAS